MSFLDEQWDDLLPTYLTNTTKDRLKEALGQFKTKDKGSINYDQFFKDWHKDYFLQGDLIVELRVPIWNLMKLSFDKAYINAIILSNTCDISFGNKREINSKQCLFAPLIDLDDHIEELKALGYDDKRATQFRDDVRSQMLSNIFYLPGIDGKTKEQIALFDQIFWFPISEMKSLIETIDEERITSLNYFGYYLFILKLSYHFCRLPEQCDREITGFNN